VYSEETMPTQLFRQEKLHRIAFRISTGIGKNALLSPAFAARQKEMPPRKAAALFL
jgi:hypothetical protein